MAKALVVGLWTLLTLAAVGPRLARAAQTKCLAAKTKCASKALTGLLKCHQSAETPGKPTDPDFGSCIDKVHAKFDGGPKPATGCFEKLESKLPNDCISFDDTTWIESTIDSCVAAFVTALDPPPLTQSKCGVGKKKCAAKKAKGALKCRQLAQTPGKPADANAGGCLDKVQLKFDGGVAPEKGCFEHLESKVPNDCEVLDDTSSARALIDDCVAQLTAKLENPTTTSTSTSSSTSSSTSTSSTSTSSTSSTSTSTSSTTSTSSSSASSSTSTTTSSSTTTSQPPLLCPASGLVDARLVVPYNLVGAPALSGIRTSVHYPSTTSLPNIPTTTFVDPSRVTNLTPFSPFLLSQDLDTDMNSVEDTVETLYALTNQTFPPGNLVSIRFDCLPVSALGTALFPCQVTQASDAVGNDVQNPGAIPCAIAELTPVP
jgi:hypothetical protein